MYNKSRKYYRLMKRGKRLGFLTIGQVAELKNVSVYTIRNNFYKFSFYGSCKKIKFNEFLINWNPQKRQKNKN